MPKRPNFLTGATNDFGTLSDDVRERIFRYLNDPTAENWSNIYSIIINSGGSLTGKPPRTVWQAVVALDPSFKDISLPGSKASTPHEQRWQKWPDPLLVARAIKAAIAAGSQPPASPRHRR